MCYMQTFAEFALVKDLNMRIHCTLKIMRFSLDLFSEARLGETDNNNNQSLAAVVLLVFLCVSFKERKQKSEMPWVWHFEEKKKRVG